MTMTEQNLTMTVVEEQSSLIQVQEETTVSHTVLKAEGARIVLFAFDEGQVLTEHTAAMPVIIQVLSGHPLVTTDGRTVDPVPGGAIHLGTRLPHSVEALEATKMQLVMLDAR